MNFEWALKYLTPGDFIVMAFVIIWSWFLYKNFAKKVISKIDSRVSAASCLALRNQCGIMIAERRNGLKAIASAESVTLTNKLNFIEEKFADEVKAVNEKIDSIIETQREDRKLLLKLLERK